jgi:hypothetical protein
MRPGRKYSISMLFLLLGLALAQPVLSQTGVAEGESKHHKRLWRRWNKKKDGYNPYVKHDKSTHAVSRKEKQKDDEALKRAKKEYKKGIKRSARKRRKG